MIFNKRFIFIHIGKTGGMSCSNFLINNLKDYFYIVSENSEKELENAKNSYGVAIRGSRHSSLQEGLVFYREKFGNDSKPEKIYAVIRHPVTLEWSYYHHLRKPSVIAARKDGPILSAAQRDFDFFIENCGYHRPNFSQEKFVTLNETLPSNLEFIKYENLAIEFPLKFENELINPLSLFPHRNKTSYTQDLRESLTINTLEKIYIKHKYMFDAGFYDLNNLEE